MRWPSSFALALLVLAGCDGARPGPEDAGATDAGAIDAGSVTTPDAGVDAGPTDCPSLLMDRRIAYDPGTVDGQIHPVARWDGEGIWVAYCKPDPEGFFDVWATRLRCDGRALVEPFSVSSDPALGNDIDPELVLDGDAVFIAWNTDDGTGGTDNLSVRYRRFALDGTPMGDDVALVTTHEGEPVMANQLGVKLAVRPGGGVMVAGARGVPDVVPAFSAYAQPLDGAGAPDGSTIAPLLEDGASQTNVDVAVTADGATWVAFDRSTTDPETEHVRVWTEGVVTPGPAIEGLDSTSGASLLALDGAVWAAMAGLVGSEVDLRILDVSLDVGDRQPATLGTAGRFDHSPRLAAADDGSFAVVWFRQVRGFTNEVFAARVVPGTPPTVGEVVRVDTRNAPAYQPALTHVMGDFFFASFAEGTSPDFRLVGRFVELPRP